MWTLLAYNTRGAAICRVDKYMNLTLFTGVIHSSCTCTCIYAYIDARRATRQWSNLYLFHFNGLSIFVYHQILGYLVLVCGTSKCENVSICEKVARSEEISTQNLKIDAICEKITLDVKKKVSLNV